MPKAQKTAIKASTKKAGSKKIAKPAAKKAVKSSKIVKTITVYRNQSDYFALDSKYLKMGLSTRAIHAGN